MLRQLSLICASIVFAGALMHGQVASALLSRGDDILRRGNPIAALRYYRRALFFQPHLDDAIDRITLIALLTHDHLAMELALHLTRTAESQFPNDAAFAQDRALVAMRMHLLPEAQSAFERAGRLHNDWQSYAFASFLARRLGDSASARRDWAFVAHLNPKFARFHGGKRAR